MFKKMSPEPEGLPIIWAARIVKVVHKKVVVFTLKLLGVSMALSKAFMTCRHSGGTDYKNVFWTLRFEDGLIVQNVAFEPEGLKYFPIRRRHANAVHQGNITLTLLWHRI